MLAADGTDDPVREDLATPCRRRARRRPHAAVRRPSPRAGRFGAGVRHAAPARSRAAGAGTRVRHTRPLHSDQQPQSRGCPRSRSSADGAGARRRHGEGGHPVFRYRRSTPRHHPRTRSGAGSIATGHAHRVRRQPYVDARCARRARVRHRCVGSGARARDANGLAAAAEDVAHHRPRRTRCGRDSRRTSFSRSLQRSGRQVRPATRSSTPARRCARCRWKGASLFATCRSRPVLAQG